MTKSIIIIDDDPADLAIIKEAFEKSEKNVKCISFLYPEEAVRVITEELNTTPQFIIVDFNMPGKNGLECLKEFRRHSFLKEVPILIYSSKILPEIKDILLSEGATHVFEKPSFMEWGKLIPNIFAITRTSDGLLKQSGK